MYLSNEESQELYLRERWNATVGHSTRGCAPAARRWIEQRVRDNKRIIDILKEEQRIRNRQFRKQLFGGA